MTRAFVVASLLAVAGARASAQPTPADPSVEDPESTMVRVREHFARGEYAEAKALLETAFAASASPALLFALGQVSFNLGEFQQAIGYYEKFLRTDPDAEQAALAQQAIGAARARIAAPPPPPPLPPPPPNVHKLELHPWSPVYTGLLVIGGAAVITGGAFIYHGHGLGRDETGTLTNYERRLERSRIEQNRGLAIAIGGGVAIAAAFVIWRVRTETRIVVTPRIEERAASLSLGGSW